MTGEMRGAIPVLAICATPTVLFIAALVLYRLWPDALLSVLCFGAVLGLFVTGPAIGLVWDVYKREKRGMW